MSVVLTKVGLFDIVWHPDSKQYIREKVERKNILAKLREYCDVEVDVTLADVFQTVAHYKTLCTLLAGYSWCSFIDAFHTEIHKPVIEDDQNPDDQIDHLEVYWASDLLNKKDLELAPAFHGISIPRGERAKYTAPGEMVRWGLALTPLYALSRLPVRLNKKIAIYGSQHQDDKNVLFSAEKDFTLLEVLDSIYWEISFHGGPEQKKSFIGEVTRKIENIKKAT